MSQAATWSHAETLDLSVWGEVFVQQALEASHWNKYVSTIPQHVSVYPHNFFLYYTAVLTSVLAAAQLQLFLADVG